jgi:hypothetical protein
MIAAVTILLIDMIAVSINHHRKQKVTVEKWGRSPIYLFLRQHDGSYLENPPAAKIGK